MLYGAALVQDAEREEEVERDSTCCSGNGENFIETIIEINKNISTKNRQLLLCL